MTTYTESDLKLAVQTSTSYSGVLSKLGKSKTGASYELIQRKIKEFGLDITHFNEKSRTVNSNKKPWTEILILNEKRGYRESGSRLRKALIESGRRYKCEECPNEGTWNGKEIILEVDHKDGNWQNNLPENLRFLCPNCHSQTENFYNQKETKYCSCGKPMFKKSTSCIACHNSKPRNSYRKVKDRPSKEQLEQDIKDIKYFVQIGKKYGVSDNAVRKWAKSYGILWKSC